MHLFLLDRPCLITFGLSNVTVFYFFFSVYSRYLSVLIYSSARDAFISAFDDSWLSRLATQCMCQLFDYHLYYHC